MRAEATTTDGLQRATALHARGVAEHNSGRPLRARRLFDRAVEALRAEPTEGDGHRRLDVALRVSVALNEAETNGVERGLAALEEARTRAESLGHPDLLVRVHNQTGYIAIRAGMLDVALASYEAATTMLEHTDLNDHFAILLNAGNLHLYRGDLAAARRLLESASAFARENRMRDEQFKAQHNLGYLEFLAGDLPLALRLMDEAGRANLTVSPAVALLDQARVLAEAGLTREADDALARAAAIFRRDRLAQDLGEVDLERARCALISGDAAGARRYAGRARDRFRRRGNHRSRRAAELLLLQGDLAAGRPPGRLVEPALRLREELAADGAQAAARTAGLVAVEALLDARDAARARLVAESLGPLEPAAAVSARLHDDHVAARLDLAAGRPGPARRRVRSGLADLAAHQARFGSIDLQTAAAVHGRRLAQLDLATALDTGRADQVFAAAERARAVSARLPTVRPPDDPVVAELLTDLRQVVEGLRAVEQDRAAAAPLEQRRRQLERQIAGRRWSVAGAGSATRVATTAAVREALGPGEVMVGYVQVAGRLHAVVVGDGPVRMHDLGASAEVVELVRRVRADLDVLAYPRMPAPLVGAVRATLARSLARLDDVLVRPLRLDGRRLVVSSTGSLGQLPWGALPGLRGVPVVVAPSATAWLSATTAPPVDGEVVALAGPDLARAADEAAGVALAHRGAAVVTGADADCAAFTAALAKARLLHVAAHGVHQTENPLFSCVRLADGVLFAHELDRTARTPEHVVLSACELGLATVRPGDEALGLTSVLLHLGTRSVVAGVARVGDDPAAETMADYHRRLAAGDDSAAALAHALARRADTPVPFVCFGTSWAFPQ